MTRICPRRQLCKRLCSAPSSVLRVSSPILCTGLRRSSLHPTGHDQPASVASCCPPLDMQNLEGTRGACGAGVHLQHATRHARCMLQHMRDEGNGWSALEGLEPERPLEAQALDDLASEGDHIEVVLDRHVTEDGAPNGRRCAVQGRVHPCAVDISVERLPRFHCLAN